MTEQAYMPIRYSSLTENAPNAGKRGLSWLWWVWIGFAVLLFFAWRSDWVVTGGAARIENPYGWR